MPFLTAPVLPAGTLSSRPQPRLPTVDGLLLRPFEVGDVAAVHAVFQDPVMHQWHVRAAESLEEVGGVGGGVAGAVVGGEECSVGGC